MKTVTVDASKRYNIAIGSGILDGAGELTRAVTSARTAAIVTDDIVDGLYCDRLSKSLEQSGFRAVKYVFPHGEASKNAATFIALLTFLAGKRITRSDVILALGGGVVGDLAGFAAASYMRGVGYIQVPTTLLAMTDSSVGGKTAIDLAAGKNLAGAFYQPELVVCDYGLLETLAPETFRDGCAEVIKYGVIADRELFRRLYDPIEGQLEEVIARCVEIKSDIVSRDERERGERKLLNFGHTVGHAVELLSGFQVPHGSAVAAGMAIIARASANMKIGSRACAADIVELLGRYGLPTTTDFSARDLARACLSDKKRSGDFVTLIVPEEIGRCALRDTRFDELERVIAAGLEPFS